MHSDPKLNVFSFKINQPISCRLGNPYHNKIIEFLQKFKRQDMKYAQQFKISDEYSCTECYDRDDQEFSMASKNIAKKGFTK